jgi:hypothetical protein
VLPLDAVRERLCAGSWDGGIRGRLVDDLGSGVEDRVSASEAMDKLSRRKVSGLTAEGLIGGVGGTEGMLSDPLRETVRSESLGGRSGTDGVSAGVVSAWGTSPVVGFDSGASSALDSSWLVGPLWEEFDSVGGSAAGCGVSFLAATSGMVLRTSLSGSCEGVAVVFGPASRGIRGSVAVGVNPMVSGVFPVPLSSTALYAEPFSDDSLGGGSCST